MPVLLRHYLSRPETVFAMSFLNPSQRRFVVALSRLAFCNPFHRERIELEQAVLGKAYQPEELVVWNRTADVAHAERGNVIRLTKKADELAEAWRSALVGGDTLDDSDQPLYEDLVHYVLYYRWIATLSPAGLEGHKASIGSVWKKFHGDFRHFLQSPGMPPLQNASPEHLFACLHQVRRAFRHIFDCIYGDSMPAARLRGMVWQSIFTHDMRRYRRTLYDRMADFATLITGPSGTGKELVARSIALSQYLSFDSEKLSLIDKPEHGFIPLNLSALSPTLVESELFGHARGAFTGASSDRVGWLESCPSHGAVFLDEIGELEPAIQVKLLRVVQSREFCRLGETDVRPFAGKIITATNRDLAAEIEAGRFRRDLFYRLCSDHIQTPSLNDQVADRPEALSSLIRLLAERIAGADGDALAGEVEGWIDEHLGAGYAWPGNIRELEQCVRNILVRHEYVPLQPPVEADGNLPAWLAGVEQGTLTADELLRRYATALYAKHGSYEQAAQVLGLDRRTVRAKIDEPLLAEIQAESRS